LFIQSWLTLATVSSLALWLMGVDRNVRGHEEVLADLRGQLVQTGSQLQQRERLDELRKQWQQQAEVLKKMGAHVEASRLLSRLSSVPQNIYFMDLSVDTQEYAAALTNVAKATLKDAASVPMERKMQVRMQGVAPTDVELATLLTELNKVSFFENVAPTYVKDRREAGHVLREFELTFTIPLSTAEGS
jgi:hypothetical protein